MKLTIELVPKTAWNKNLRSLLSKVEWDELRDIVFENAGHKCEICGGQGNKWPVECHEIWKYDDDNKIQKLIGCIALCPKCHACKHLGLAMNMGKFEECRLRLSKINNISLKEVEDYIEQEYWKWRERSKHEWKIELNFGELKHDNFFKEK